MTSMLDGGPEPIQLSSRFAKLKRNMIACREKEVADSFYRLLRALRKEADEIAARGSDVIPTIDYFDIHDAAKASAFRRQLRKCGVAVIKRVIPHGVARAWNEETHEYIADNPQTRGHPAHDPELFDLYWSPSQVRARADSRLLDAQRFAMATWHAGDDEDDDDDEHPVLVSANHPVAYADRLSVRMPNDAGSPISPGSADSNGNIHIDNGSVERWEPDGYGASGTYGSVFSGRWEEYDPWDSSPRLRITTDLYNRSGSCSMFRMFQGFLSLSAIPEGSSGGALTVCPMLQLSTAYLLLRPFFTPRYKDAASMLAASGSGSGGSRRGARERAEMDFLHPNNWNLNVSQTSVLHGAVPGYVQELSAALHPHLQLNRTMVSVPDLEPGDYVIWHPDAVHAVDAPYFPHLHPHAGMDPSVGYPSSPGYPFLPPNLTTSSSFSSSNPFSPISPSGSRSSSGSISSYYSHGYNTGGSSSTSSSSVPSPSYSRSRHPSHSHAHSRGSISSMSSNSIRHATSLSNPAPYAPDVTVLYIPACPLTQTNALYLARQRRAFLLGLAAPDFAEAGNGSAGERDHAGRSGVQDVADAGGEHGLRSMGLAPWEESVGHHHHHHHHTSSSSSTSGRRERDKDVLRLLRLANGILFPDRFDGVLKKGGGRR